MKKVSSYKNSSKWNTEVNNSTTYNVINKNKSFILKCKNIQYELQILKDHSLSVEFLISSASTFATIAWYKSFFVVANWHPSNTFLLRILQRFSVELIPGENGGQSINPNFPNLFWSSNWPGYVQRG